MINETFKIQIPTDDDGFVLLKCEYCGIYFKLTPYDMEDDGILDIYCPCCGLTIRNYITDDVIELAFSMTNNKVLDMINSEFSKIENKLNNDLITFKITRKGDYKPENPIRLTIEALEITYFPCCHRNAKIKPLLKMTGCYCPFCGVKEYETE